MRTPKPWFRRQNDTWYVCLHGQQVPLAKGKDKKKDAERAFFRLMSSDVPLASRDLARMTVATVFDHFLEWAHTHLESFEWHRHFLEAFARRHGGHAAAELKPIHVTQWLGKQSWGPTTQNRVIGILKRALNWAVEQGVLQDNPIRTLKKPTPLRRERLLTDEEREEIFRHARGPAFKDFLLALQETGARPGELRALARENVDLVNGLWVFPLRHKTYKQTRRPRVIYLNATMLELTKRLMKQHEVGPLFRNSRGKTWTKNAIRCRFAQLRTKLPHLKDVVSYCYRHSFATEGLERGVPIATMAELLGHKSTTMISNHYGHLAEKKEHLRNAVATATRSTEMPGLHKGGVSGALGRPPEGG